MSFRRIISLVSVCLLMIFNFGCSKANNTAVKKRVLSGRIIGAETRSKVWVFDFKTSEVLNDGVINKNKTFKVSFEAPSGIYRLLYRVSEKEYYLDVVFDEEVSVHVDINLKKKGSSYVFSSSNNKEWYAFKKKNDKNINEIDSLIYAIKATMKKGENNLSTEKAHLKKLKLNYLKYVKGFVNKHRNSFIGKLVENTKEWFPKDFTLSKSDEYTQYIKEYWREDLDLNDEMMVRTPLYYDLTKNYIQLFFRFKVSEAILKIKTAIDFVMKKFNKSPLNTRKQVTTAIIKTIDFPDLRTVLKYFDETYVDATLVEGRVLKSHIRRMESYRNLQKGELTPNIQFKDDNGQEMSIKDIKSKYTILAFYSSTCSHCKEQMPSLNKFLKTHPKFKALAVSCDKKESKKDYMTFKMKLSDMYHFCDFKGFESGAFEKYYINSTPTIFLLDKDKKLIKNYGSVTRFFRIFGNP